MKELLTAIVVNIYGFWCRLWDKNSYVMWSNDDYDGPSCYMPPEMLADWIKQRKV